MNFRFRIFGCALALIVSAASPAGAQTRAVEDTQDLINWYYSATFGTGVYTAGDRTVAVLQLPFSRTLRPVEEGTYGLRFKFPVTLGVYDYAFDDVFAGDFPEALSTLSILPGLEWEMPITSQWTLKPYLSAGAGTALDGNESALIYDFGFKSRFILARHQGVEFAMVNMLTAAGYRPEGGPSQPFGVLAAGLDIVVPTEKVVFGRDAFLGFTASYYYYFNELRFAKFDDADNRVREQVEFAVSLLSRRPWTLKFFDVDRIGFAVRSSGDVIGVSLITSLPF